MKPANVEVRYGLSVRVEPKKGEYSDLRFDFVDADGLLYKGIDQKDAPEGILQGHWDFIRTMAFLPFSSITTNSGTYKGKSWDRSKGVGISDVLQKDECYEIIAAQYIWDSITNRHHEKIRLS